METGNSFMTGIVKRLEALIALAMRRAGSGLVSATTAFSFANAGTVAAGASIIAVQSTVFPSIGSGKYLVTGGAFATHSAVDTAATFQLIRDPGGANTPIGPIFTADSSHVNKNVCVTIPPTVDVPGVAVHAWGLRVATAAGTVTIALANEAELTVWEL